MDFERRRSHPPHYTPHSWTLVFLLSLVAFRPGQLFAQKITVTPIISTTAGNGNQGYSGDSAQATAAMLATPYSVAVDRAGNEYIADYLSSAIRKVDVNGMITTFAGNGSFSPEVFDGPAATTPIGYPAGVAVDNAGNVYFTDIAWGHVRVVNTQSSPITIAGVSIQPGHVTVIAGTSNSSGPFCTIPCSALQVDFRQPPWGLSVDNNGNIYTAHYTLHTVFKIDSSGTLTVLAGIGTPGYNGDGIAATSAQLNFPYGVSSDPFGNVFIADFSNSRVRKVDSNGVITTVAGNGTPGFSGDGGPAIAAELGNPIGVLADALGDLYITDFTGARVRKVDSSGTISTLAGSGLQALVGDGGPSTQAGLTAPGGVALDPHGGLYIADQGDHVIRKLSFNQFDAGQVHVGQSVSVSGYFSINAPLTLTSLQASGDFIAFTSGCNLNQPLPADTTCAVTGIFQPTQPGDRSAPLILTDSSGNKYGIAQHGVGLGAAAALTPGIISTFAGNGNGNYDGDGVATNHAVNQPAAVAVDAAGNTYIADVGNAKLRKVDSSGAMTTLPPGGFFSSVAVDAAGNVYFSDADNSLVYRMNVNGNVVTLAGVSGHNGYNGDLIPAASAWLSYPQGVSVDKAGNVYIADLFNQRVRKVDVNGIITTVAGNGGIGGGGDGGSALNATFTFPYAAVADSAGNIFIADSGNGRLRKVDTNGNINTVAGSLGALYDVKLDSAGNSYAADVDNCRIEKIDGQGTVTTVAGNGCGFGGDGGPATNPAVLGRPFGLAVDNVGDLYIADYYNNRIRKVNVSSSALSFGTVNVNQNSGTQQVDVANVGNFDLDFTSPFGFTANFHVAAVGGDCSPGTPVSAGDSCALGAVFAPLVTGSPLSGTLTITDDAFSSPQLVALSGIATLNAPSVTFTGAPGSAVFGSTFPVTATTNASTMPTITGTGACSAGPVSGTPANAAATITMASGTGTCNLTAAWAADANYDATSLPQATGAGKAGSSTIIDSNTPSPSLTGQAVTISFHVTTGATGATGNVTVNASTLEHCAAPLISGVASCQITFSTAGPRTLTASYSGDLNFLASLSGTANQTVNLASGLNFVPPSIDFGTVTLWGGSSQILTLTNTTASTVRISKVSLGSLANVTSKDLTYDGGCMSPLAPGKNCRITLSLWPGKIGAVSAVLTLTNNAPGNPHHVLITATVIAPKATVSVSSLNFGNQKVNTTSASKIVTLTNNGIGPLTISAITLTGSNASDFPIASNTCASTLGQGSSCTVGVTFRPRSKNSRSATLKFSDNAQSATQTVSLTGKGT